MKDIILKLSPIVSAIISYVITTTYCADKFMFTLTSSLCYNASINLVSVCVFFLILPLFSCIVYFIVNITIKQFLN